MIASNILFSLILSTVLYTNGSVQASSSSKGAASRKRRVKPIDKADPNDVKVNICGVGFSQCKSISCDAFRAGEYEFTLPFDSMQAKKKTFGLVVISRAWDCYYCGHSDKEYQQGHYQADGVTEYKHEGKDWKAPCTLQQGAAVDEGIRDHYGSMVVRSREHKIILVDDTRSPLKEMSGDEWNPSAKKTVRGESYF